MLSDQQTQELIQRRDAINPAELSRDIYRLQCILSGFAKSKTDSLVLEVAAAKERKMNRMKSGVRIVV